MIKLLTMKDGKIVMDRKASPTASLDDIVYIAEREVNDGYADYSCVTVDGEIYAEYEA